MSVMQSCFTGRDVAVKVPLRHLSFIILCSRSSLDLTTSSQSDDTLKVEPDITDFLNETTVRDMVRGVVERGQGLLNESHLLWRSWFDWEMDMLLAAKGDMR